MVKKIQKKDIRRARRFAHTFRFIDDLNALNDGGEFERFFKEIYPIELELGRENENDQCASFLDLDINIENNKFVIGLFDKRDGFPFSIVRMPFCSSNMPSSIFYASVGAEVLRIARATSNSDKFLISVNTLISRMIMQGAKRSRTINTLLKTFGRHNKSFKHISQNAREFVNQLVTV